MPKLPSGTVTFLFTDIEGSTALWERDPIAMKTALATHHAILQQAIESHQGIVFQIVGDSIEAVFKLAREAITAALEIQLALQRAAWEGIEGLHVRAGLSTGLGELQGELYSSNQTLNRVARVMSAAYGDQILLSEETAELVRRELPPGIALVDLGDQRLKGLSRPVRLFQVVAPGLRREFPPLPTHILPPSNLPSQLTSFVGRQAEIMAICEELRQPAVRLLTLTGVGGTGKTRISIQAGQALLADFPDGVFFIPLAAVHEDDLVIPTIAEQLGLRESPGRSSFTLLKEHLVHKQLLLILDNFEQIVEAGQGIIELLAAAPRLKMLVTSRSLLRLAAEHDHPIAPLSLPRPDSRQDLAEIGQNEAVQLFVQRARAVKQNFQLSEENCQAVAEICRRLDGLPLALELAAARCRLLSPQAMLEQLDSRLNLLVGGARDLPERHQTMRAAIEWSYKLLTLEEQVLFRRLAVFAGGCSLQAVEKVCAEDGMRLLDNLESLLDKSLVRQSEFNNDVRLWMFETIREYGLELLESSGELDMLRQRHAHFYIQFLNQFSQELDHLEPELDNFRLILRWSIDSRRPNPGYRIMSQLFFWGIRSSEGRRWLSELLRLPVPAGHMLRRGHAGFVAGHLAISQGDFDAGQAMMAELQRLANEMGVPILQDYASYGTGLIFLHKHQIAAAIQVFSDLEKKIGAGMSWWLVPWVYFVLSVVLAIAGENEKAGDYLQSAYHIFAELEQPIGITVYTVESGYRALARGDLHLASEYFAEGIGLANQHAYRRSLGSCVRGFAGIALGAGDLVRCARLFGAAEALIKITGWYYSEGIEKAIIGRYLTDLRLRMDAETLAAAWAEGERMDLEEVVAYALDSAPDE